jgi:competence protein ComEA
MPSFPLSVTQRRAIAAVLLGLVVLVVAVRHHEAKGGSGAAAPLPAPISSSTDPEGAASEGAASDGTASATATPEPASGRIVVVDVAGSVRRPGLYRLQQGARVADAVARAGGLTRHADSTLINLAAPLADGEQVLVSAQGGGASAAAAGGGASSAPVHLNSAGADELDGLPGVGPVTAQKIVTYRQQHGPFTSLEGLDAIPGIGPARISSLKGLAVP